MYYILYLSIEIKRDMGQMITRQ